LGWKTTLRLRVHSFCKLLKARECHTGKELASNAKERDAPIIVAITAVTLVLEQGRDDRISHLLGDCSLLPAFAQQLIEHIVKLDIIFATITIRHYTSMMYAYPREMELKHSKFYRRVRELYKNFYM